MRKKNVKPELPPTCVNWPPYPGYEKHPDDRSKFEKACELIHRMRRQVALHSYLYYECNCNIICDHEYEIRVKKLVLAQLLHPKASLTVPFMRKAFVNNKFESTGFHIADMVRSSDEGKDDAYSVMVAAERFRANPPAEYAGEDMRGRLKDLTARVNKVKALIKRKKIANQ